MLIWGYPLLDAPGWILGLAMAKFWNLITAVAAGGSNAPRSMRSLTDLVQVCGNRQWTALVQK